MIYIAIRVLLLNYNNTINASCINIMHITYVLYVFNKYNIPIMHFFILKLLLLYMTII